MYCSWSSCCVVLGVGWLFDAQMLNDRGSAGRAGKTNIAFEKAGKCLHGVLFQLASFCCARGRGD